MGTSANLSATGGTSYQWSNGQSGASIAVSPTVTTIYTVTTTDANGCTDTDNVTVTVNPAPTANAGADQTICSGSSVNLIATGGTSYQWSSGQSGASISVLPTVTTMYTVTITDANGCTDTDDVTVTVNSAPTANAGADQNICSGASANLSATGGSSYQWSSGQSGANISVLPTVTTIYTVTVTGTNGCTNTDNLTVTVNPLPTANAGADQAICLGTSANLSATGGSSYQWSNGQSGASITVSPTVATIYTVTTTDANGCTNTDNVTVTVNTPSTPTVIQQNDILTASTANSYQWFLNNIAIGGATSQTLVMNQNGDYTVETTDANGCLATSNTLTIINVSTFNTVFKNTKVYPNPFNDYLIIENGQGKATIYNLLGQPLEELRIANNILQMSTAKLPRGSYLLVIERESGERISFKILK